jgi:hypothetical protein
MAVMSKYCKAIPHDRLAQFDGWEELCSAVEPADGKSEPYLFVHDDYAVTRGVFRDEAVVVGNPTAAWKDYCVNVLQIDPDVCEVGTVSDTGAASASGERS